MTTTPIRRYRAIAATLALLAAPIAAQLVTSPTSADEVHPVVHWDARPADAYGWYTHEVPVELSVTSDVGIDLARSEILVYPPNGDDPTGIGVPRNTLDMSVAAQGVTVIYYDVYDTQGHEAAGERMFYLDSRPPAQVTAGLPADSSTITQGSAIPVVTSCDDSLPDWRISYSGVTDCDFTTGVFNGQLDTSTPGPLTVTQTTGDLAGNVTTVIHTYTVSGTTTPPKPTRPANTAKPAVTGTHAIGGTLTGTAGQWTGGSLTYTYQWFSQGLAIPGATQTSYQVQPSDLQRKIQLKVTAANTAGKRTVASTPVLIRH